MVQGFLFFMWRRVGWYKANDDIDWHAATIRLKCSLCLLIPEHSRVHTGSHIVNKICPFSLLHILWQQRWSVRISKQKIWLNLNKVARVFTPLNWKKIIATKLTYATLNVRYSNWDLTAHCEGRNTMGSVPTCAMKFTHVPESRHVP